ncbi:MAG: hypothetical protein RLZ97_2453, partial [Verrucomicrobiota bacterium]
AANVAGGEQADAVAFDFVGLVFGEAEEAVFGEMVAGADEARGGFRANRQFVA